jgi:multiple sugar transport system substrate-binding protein
MFRELNGSVSAYGWRFPQIQLLRGVRADAFTYYAGNIMKTSLTRRTLVKGGTALATSGALAGPGLLEWAKAWAQTAPWRPEKGAQLSLLRPKSFVPAEDEVFVAATDAFSKATGVKISIIRESNDDVQPKASVAANVGAGPDLFWGWFSLPHLFSNKCLDVTDVADYLGKKYCAWAPSAIVYGKGAGSRWIDIPVCYVGALINYRISSLKRAGFSKFPETTEAFLDYAKAMKANNTPGGFALGHSTTDANGWVYWCLWAHGGNVVNKNDKIILNSPETEKALNYAKALYNSMIPGVAAWNDASNNKAFLANEIHWTNNAISIYVAATKDPTKKEIAEDMDHAYWPVGPVGHPTELHLALSLLTMTYTKYPEACRALMAFLMEADQYNSWLHASQGLLTHTLNAYDNNPIWTEDPKNAPFRDAAKRSLTVGGLGSVGEKAATGLSDFVLVDMFANVCTGREDAKGAMKMAERQLQRIYR